ASLAGVRYRGPCARPRVRLACPPQGLQRCVPLGDDLHLFARRLDPLGGTARLHRLLDARHHQLHPIRGDVLAWSSAAQGVRTSTSIPDEWGEMTDRSNSRLGTFGDGVFAVALTLLF